MKAHGAAVPSPRSFAPFGSPSPILKSILAAFAIASLAPFVHAQSYSITDLGALPGATATFAFGINDAGEVAGWSGSNSAFNGTSLSTGYVWSGGVMQSIGWLGNPGSGLFAVNDLGQGVGVANPGLISGSFQSQGVLYRNNTLITIDTSASSLFAHYITDTGIIVGDYNKGGGGSSGGTFVPAFWVEEPTKPGRFRRTDLQPIAGDLFAYANAANQSMVVVGYTATQAFGTRACLWNNDAKHTPTLLAPALGDQTGAAQGVNNFGVACGYSWYGIYRTTPVVWSADATHTPTVLPALPGTTHAWAKAINNQGQVIGYGGDASGVGGTVATTGATPVVWLNGQIYTLQSLLDASGAGWQNVEAVAINNLGQIAGNGLHNGVPSAFILNPN